MAITVDTAAEGGGSPNISSYTITSLTVASGASALFCTPTATPGQPWTFSAKPAAATGAAQVTQLSVMALPGQIQSFAAKDEADTDTGDALPLPIRIHHQQGRRPRRI